MQPSTTNDSHDMISRYASRNRILAIAAGGISIAMATVLSLLKLFAMPQGGSITPASMLPIILYSLCFGPVWGVGVGIVRSEERRVW